MNTREKSQKARMKRDLNRAEAVRFGALIREYQDKWGLSNTDMARLIFNNEGSSNRVADLKAGRNNPGPEIKAAARDALQIPQERIDACRAPIADDLSESEREQIDLSRELIESLALRFECTNPDAPTSDLIRFLKQKAKEFRQLKARLDELTKVDMRIDAELQIAESVMKTGDFEAAERLLAKVEDLHQTEKTLVQVRRQADIRRTRAEVALFDSNADEALRHFRICASYFDPFDIVEGAKYRDEAAQALIEHGFYYGGSAHAGAIELWELNLAALTAEEYHLQLAHTQFSLGFAKMELGMRASPVSPVNLLSEAVEHYQQSLFITEKDGPTVSGAKTCSNMGIALKEIAIRQSGDSVTTNLQNAVKLNQDAIDFLTAEKDNSEWVSVANNLAICLKELGAHKGDAIALAHSAHWYNATLDHWNLVEYPIEWASVQNNLGNLHRLLAMFEAQNADDNDNEDIDALYQGAILAFESALIVRTKEENPREWAATNENMAFCYLTWAQGKSRREAKILLEKARACFEYALEIWEPAYTASNWIKSKQFLAKTYANLALFNIEIEYYMRCAVREFTSIQAILTKQERPVDWGALEENIACLKAAVGNKITGERAEALRRESIRAFDRAEAVFAEAKLDKRLQECRRLRETLH